MYISAIKHHLAVSCASLQYHTPDVHTLDMSRPPACSSKARTALHPVRTVAARHAVCCLCLCTCGCGPHLVLSPINNVYARNGRCTQLSAAKTTAPTTNRKSCTQHNKARQSAALVSSNSTSRLVSAALKETDTTPSSTPLHHIDTII